MQREIPMVKYAGELNFVEDDTDPQNTWIRSVKGFPRAVKDSSCEHIDEGRTIHVNVEYTHRGLLLDVDGIVWLYEYEGRKSGNEGIPKCIRADFKRGWIKWLNR